ncbi:hypothetical protein GA0115240_114910 [Streptomyces sp. DvalAA-14]|uniref:hypothetical protein n=1 Tax=unclassified Streptomyces TaxID=2593676 RepID=UPI00081B6C13|nr:MULTISPECIES: hypothetical protein [unclassified Streptomyces]MYS19920.1 hypothetical protein [Streptomyces sp. SID4948]SCD56576.1 hypothetical protein GA0115240_114910 [Streptomyces sp. DvalAA-14]
MLLKENDQVMIERSQHAEDWFVWGMYCADSPHSPGGSHFVVELPAVMEMIEMVAQGHVTGGELRQALDDFARRFHAPEQQTGSFGPLGRSASFDGRTIGEDCPHGCPVCAGAQAEFDAIAAESLTHKVRLSDPDQHPYAAGKHTLHRSTCPKVARFVGRVEPVGSPRFLAGLPAFAHQGVCSTAWAAGMQVLTTEEAAVWIHHHSGPQDGDPGYKICCQCLPPLPGTTTAPPAASTFGAGYWGWETQSAVTWG